MKRNEKERKVILLEASLTELEKEYDQVFDALLTDDSEANRNKERMLFQSISAKKKELEKLKGDEQAFSDEEIEEIANGVSSEKQELTEAEEKMFNAIADSF
jgi:hypothetical protein